MKLLVHGKADINTADGKSGRTPLHHSVETDDLSLAAYLILQVNESLCGQFLSQNHKAIYVFMLYRHCFLLAPRSVCGNLCFYMKYVCLSCVNIHLTCFNLPIII